MGDPFFTNLRWVHTQREDHKEITREVRIIRKTSTSQHTHLIIKRSQKRPHRSNTSKLQKKIKKR